jgi:hypothetical protein
MKKTNIKAKNSNTSYIVFILCTGECPPSVYSSIKDPVTLEESCIRIARIFANSDTISERANALAFKDEKTVGWYNEGNGGFSPCDS